MKIILPILSVFLVVLFSRADWRGVGNANIYFAGVHPIGNDSPTNKMNILSNNITIACWLKIMDTGTGLEQKNVFFGKGQLEVLSDLVYMLRIKGAKLEFNYNDGVNATHTYASTSTFIWTNRLRFVALTYTFTNAASMQLYMDGEPVTGSWTAGNGNSNCKPNAREFTISGPTAQLTGGGILMGEQGPVMAWNTNLTQQQIWMLYKAKTHGLQYTIHPKNCVFYMDWSQHRAGVPMDARKRCPDTGTFRNHMPAIGGSAQPMGSRIMCFIPNE